MPQENHYENKLTIEIRNKTPVELADLAKSMSAVASEYQNFLANHDAGHLGRDVKLYVKEIRQGSIVQELMAVSVAGALPLFDHAKTVFEYASFLHSVISWYAGKSEEEPQRLEKSSLENISSIVEPVAKDNGSNLILNISNNYAPVYLDINSIEANATQNSISRELRDRKEPVTGTHHQVLMYWAQARNEINNRSGDRGVIESILPTAINVRFQDESIKLRMLYDLPHPFSKVFLVDVTVETVDGKPMLYKITHLHESFDKESSD